MSPLLRPKRRADVFLATLDDETLLYHPERMTALALNATAAAIWQLCDGERTIAQIVEQLQQVYPEESAQMPAEVEAGLRTLSSHAVIALPRLGPAAATIDVELGGATARLEADDAAAAKTLEFLCESMASPPPAEAAAAVFRLGPGASAGATAVYRNDTAVYEDPSSAGASAMLLEKLQDHLVQQCTSGILLHAAALARGTRSLLLAGKTGSGKTTLATWLVRGCDYLTDELTWIDASGTTMRGFTRPLHLKPEAAALFADLFTPPASDAVAATPLGHHVSPHRLGARTRHDARPDIIVFPRYTPGARLEFHPLSKAQAASRMMACLVNARARTQNGFEDFAHFARNVSGYSMVYSDLDEAGRALEALLAC